MEATKTAIKDGEYEVSTKISEMRKSHEMLTKFRKNATKFRIAKFCISHTLQYLQLCREHKDVDPCIETVYKAF
jgi:hypothetical protein